MTKEELQKILKEKSKTASSDELAYISEIMIDAITVMLGIEKWDNADPVTVAVKVPDEIIKIAIKARDTVGISTAEFMESYIQRLIYLGIASLAKDVSRDIKDILGFATEDKDDPLNTTKNFEEI